MLLSSIKIGMVIFCTVTFNHSRYHYSNIDVENVPSKVMNIDKDSGDIWLKQDLSKIGNSGIKAGTYLNSNILTAHVGEGYLKYCYKDRK